MLCLLLSQLTFAEPSSISTTGSLRIHYTNRPGFLLDYQKNELNSGWTLDSRLRGGLHVQQDAWQFVLSGDVFHGQLLGDAWGIDNPLHRYHPERLGVINADNFLLREAHLKTQIGPVGLLAGMVTSHWGLGLVSNDGAHEHEFGRADYGDRVVRTAIFTKIADVRLSLAGDYVFEDDIGGLHDNYHAYQALTSALYAPQDDQQLGVLGVYRHQTDIITDRVLHGFFLDAFGTTTQTIGDISILAAAEVAYLNGFSDRITNRANPEGLAVSSLGSAFQTKIQHRSLGELGLRGGYASGDADPSDSQYNSFTFDRDHNAGALLFDVHQAARELAEYNLVTDPKYAGDPPDGVDSMITEGAIRETLFIQPHLSYNITEQIKLRLGSVLAWSTVPIRSGFISYRNGGVPLNYLGEETEGNMLGTEINWRVHADIPIYDPIKGRFYIEGAHLLPSSNLGTESVLSLFRVQSEFAW